MSVFQRRPREWVSKFQYRGKLHWTPGSPWPTKRMALAAEEAYRARLKGTRGQETCSSFALRWIEDWPRKATSTRKLYRQAAERFAADWADQPLGEVERPEARVWALGVPRNITKIIGTMYEDARNVGLVVHNPFANLRLPVTDKTEEVNPPTAEEWAALLDACLVHGGYATEFRSLLIVTVETALRASEVMGLRWADIDLDVGEINVCNARKDDGTYGLPKGGRSQVIALSPVARAILEEVPVRRDDDLVFHTIRGQPLAKGNLYYLWNRVRDNSGTTLPRQQDGLPAIRFHDLRHLEATRLLEAGLDHFAVSVHLRHTDGGALVMSRYGHPSKAAARDRLRALYRLDVPQIGSSASSGAAS